MNDFYDLQKSPQMEDPLTYEIVTHFDGSVFGYHDNPMIINMKTETETTHLTMQKNWTCWHNFLRHHYDLKLPRNCRQTFLQIINYLNEKYQFVNPIKIEHKRSDYRRNGMGKKRLIHGQLSLI